MRGYVFGPPPRKPLRLIAKNPVYQAFAAKPMAQDLQLTQGIDARLSFEAVSRGDYTRDDLETLESLVNLVMVLTETHCSEADQAAADDGLQAMLRALLRAQEGKPFNFDGPGRLAMMRVMDMFDELATQIGHGQIALALIEVRQRVADGMTLKRKDRKVVA